MDKTNRLTILLIVMLLVTALLYGVIYLVGKSSPPEQVATTIEDLLMDEVGGEYVLREDLTTEIQKGIDDYLENETEVEDIVDYMVYDISYVSSSSNIHVLKVYVNLLIQGDGISNIEQGIICTVTYDSTDDNVKITRVEM